MAEDPNHFLNELTVWKLKAVAEEFGVDVSACKNKRDYVQKIAGKRLTEDQVRAALNKPKKGKRGSDSEVKAIEKDIESIAKSPTEPPELSKGDEESVEKHLDEALMLRPVLFEVDSKTEAAYGKMIIGDYYEAIRLNREARAKCLEDFSSFQVYSAAVSIRAADELLSKLASEKGELDSILRTALAEAKRAFISGPPKRREDVLESLEVLATKAYDAFMANTEKEEAELMGLLADYESFGARTEESRKYVEIASQARRSMNIAEYSRLLKDARNQAEMAKDVRVKEIDNIFPIVRAAALEARDVGVDTATAEADLEEARRAFDDGAFGRAISLLASIERQVDNAHLEQIRARRDLESTQMESVRAAVARFEPILFEASSYGLDVREGLCHVSNAKAALSRRDVVNAAKYARRVKEIVLSFEKDLDAKRLERGIIRHVEDARCGKCGQESLYAYPDSTQKCMECGHSFSVLSEPAPIEGIPAPEAQPAPAEQKRTEPAAVPSESDKKKKRKLLRR